MFAEKDWEEIFAGIEKHVWYTANINVVIAGSADSGSHHCRLNSRPHFLAQSVWRIYTKGVRHWTRLSLIPDFFSSAYPWPCRSLDSAHLACEMSVLQPPHQRRLDAPEFPILNVQTCSHLSGVIGPSGGSIDDPATVLVVMFYNQDEPTLYCAASG
ncbi:hypothetical protein CSKR_101628 [Clonorchis sinensis]|uniref:Uncharacterized protein n=1 Tax=Clonorchis sinensis TaxID=79923 RepID=A0A3R7GND8_CLOSI|nr:hypothetical protein CSKR_101628 [Clonorchis sinensis]